jgi:hypothetical protein
LFDFCEDTGECSFDDQWESPYSGDIGQSSSPGIVPRAMDSIFDFFEGWMEMRRVKGFPEHDKSYIPQLLQGSLGIFRLAKRE